MPFAYLTIRDAPRWRSDAFSYGLKAAGFTVRRQPTNKPAPGDILVSWNRYGLSDIIATEFERRGCAVLIAENGYLGRDWRSANWYALSRSHHNGAGSVGTVDPGRWLALGVPIRAWRDPAPSRAACRVVILPQRGIGPTGVAMPADFVGKATDKLTRLGYKQVRVRPHPGEDACVPLMEDLSTADLVVTWGSGAALKALLNGIPVVHGMPKWIGETTESMRLDQWDGDIHHADRLPAFAKVACGMWTVDEIVGGDPIRRLL